ncbi:MAG: hypothetical protein JXQ75_02180 [Phycisphaerae bacterium]|nr:hypothetical protein [Phycisphaerae bacterium]
MSIRWSGLNLQVVVGLAVLGAGMPGTVAPARAQPDEKVVPSVAASPTPDAAQQRPPDDLIELNKALVAYHREDYAEAKRILGALRQRSPQNATCLYYLGLIYLDEGLDASRAASLDRPDKYEQARLAFSEARGLFQTVVQIADPELRPIEAALDLGIASLASDDPSKPLDAVQLARGAMNTLSNYVSQEPGRSDRLGHFFLGIAFYRLDRLDPAGRGYLRIASDSFGRALRLAERALERGEIHPDVFDEFKTRVLYYEGLIGVVRRQMAFARDRFESVQSVAASSELGRNAEQLIGEIEKEEQRQGPEPLSLESPIGPLRIEGRVGIGHQFDSSVILLGHDTTIPLDIGHKQDYRFGLDADLDVSRLITREDGLPLGESLIVGVGGAVFNLWQPSIGEFDINTYRGRSYVNWEPLEDIFIGVQYDYTYTQLGHEPFISSNRITPVLSKVWRGTPAEDGGRGEQRARTDLYYSYDYRDYFDEITRDAFDRDGCYHAVGVTQSFNLWKARDLWRDYYATADNNSFDADRWFELQLGYIYRNERTQGDEFDLFGNTVFAGVDIPLPYRLAFDFAGEFTWDDYTQRSLIDFRRNERFDFIQRYRFGLSRIIVGQGENSSVPTLQVTARAGVDLTFQDSNIWDRLSQDVFSYDRAVYSFQLMVRF